MYAEKSASRVRFSARLTPIASATYTCHHHPSRLRTRRGTKTRGPAGWLQNEAAPSANDPFASLPGCEFLCSEGPRGLVERSWLRLSKPGTTSRVSPADSQVTRH